MDTVVWPSTQPNAPQGPPNQLTQGTCTISQAHNLPVFQAPSGCQPAESEAFHQQMAPAKPALQAAPGVGPCFMSPWPQPRPRLAEKDQSTSGSASSTCSSSTSGGSGDDAGVNGSRASSGSGSGGSTPSGSSVVVTVLDAPGSSEAEGAASIYDLYTRQKMYSIMMVVALAALTAPLSNTM